jgi:hypothetical protein
MGALSVWSLGSRVTFLAPIMAAGYGWTSAEVVDVVVGFLETVHDLEQRVDQ